MRGRIGRMSAALLTLLLVAMAAGGCIYSHTSEVTISRFRRPVKEAVLSAATEGQTTRRELLQRLGPPSAVAEGTGGTEVLVYDFLERTDDRTTVMALYSRTERKTKVLRFRFELRDGVVVRAWQEVVHAR
jgi:hypothetical protein